MVYLILEMDLMHPDDWGLERFETVEEAEERLADLKAKRETSYKGIILAKLLKEL